MKRLDELFPKENIWISSDTHINHTNICSGTSRWEDKSGCRDFSSIEEMNDKIFGGINSNVKRDDCLILLGDHVFGKYKNYELFFDAIDCNNIFALCGNHDLEERLELQSKSGLYTYWGYYKETKIGKKELVLCHYPILSWNNMNRKSAMIHGHCHAGLHKSKNPLIKDFLNMKVLDVGIDNAFRMFGEYRPFNYQDDIHPYIDQRSF